MSDIRPSVDVHTDATPVRFVVTTRDERTFEILGVDEAAKIAEMLLFGVYATGEAPEIVKTAVHGILAARIAGRFRG